MNFYEELGVQADASEDEIRKAHRRLTKLFHPDQQSDESLKSLAEVQMRRLNSMVDILVNPERRRDYDDQLRQGSLPYGFAAHARAARTRSHTWRLLLWWAASAICATLLTAGAVWLWADRWVRSSGARNPTYIASPTQPGADAKRIVHTSSGHSEQAQLHRSLAPSSTIASVPTPDGAMDSVTAVEPAPDSESPRKTLILPADVPLPRPSATVEIAPPPRLPELSIPQVETALLPAAKLPVPTIPPDPVAPALPTSFHRDPLEGEWIYVPKEPQGRKPGFYPPEFIDLRLFWKQGALHGQYQAKYRVTDRPISPDVKFQLSPGPGRNKFFWAGENGSRGTLKVREIEMAGEQPRTIRIEWKTTVFSGEPSLTEGTATLVRRMQ